MSGEFSDASTLDQMQAKLAYLRDLQEITNQINAAANLDSILIDLKDRILTLLEADRITIYVVDKEEGEILSRFKVGAEVNEIRIPINNGSLAGHSALSGSITNIHNAYDEEEIKAIHPDLSFDKSWDSKTGYRTSQVLNIPIQLEDQVLGVLQLINRKDGSLFTKDDESSALEITKILAIAFRNQLRMAECDPEV